MEKIPHNGPQILLTSGHDPTLTPITHVEVTKGQHTLGVQLAPDGSEGTEYSYHLDQATKIWQRLKATPLGREHICISFNAIWKMMIKYPLGATCFTKKQCSKIQGRYLPVFLSKMGINQMTATAV